MEAIISTHERPTLVIVGGAAASGKTTLATSVARELGLPLLARDAFKEVLMTASAARTAPRPGDSAPHPMGCSISRSTSCLPLESGR